MESNEHEQDQVEEKLPGESSTLHKATVVFDGECDHEYGAPLVDDDGVMNYRCMKCPMGILTKEELRISHK